MATYADVATTADWDYLGWDNVCEGLSELTTIEEFRAEWSRYMGLYRSTRARGFSGAFYAMALVLTEQEAAKRFPKVDN